MTLPPLDAMFSSPALASASAAAAAAYLTQPAYAGNAPPLQSAHSAHSAYPAHSAAQLYRVGAEAHHHAGEGVLARPATRSINICFDDAAAAAPWILALEAEGLVAQSVSLVDHPSPHTPPRHAADAVLLHLTRPLAEHLARLRELRLQLPDMPLLVACAALRDIDQVLALEMGADDVLDGHTSPPVVAARLRALWRRCSRVAAAPPVAEELQFGSLLIQLRQHRVLKDNQIVPLTDGEFDVLWLLASQAGTTVSRRDILKRVRGIDDQPMDRSVDCRVYRIRAKLGDNQRNGAPRIRTVRNRGYLFSPIGW